MGLGNPLYRDEGLGIQALELVKTRLGLVPGLEYIDGGVLGLNLLPFIEECSHLLVLDAIDAGQPAGTRIALDRDEIPYYPGIQMSEHQIGFQDVLGLALIRGKMPPHLRLLGLQPCDLSVGFGFSPVVKKALPGLVESSLEVLCEWGVGNE
jgi:hydrogenase maturation protease